MPRNAAGTYALPLPPVVPGTTIVASFENTTDLDIATELTNSLDRNGRGGMLAPFKIADGTVSAPGIAFTLDPDNGFYRIGTDNWAATVGGVKLLEFAPNAITTAAGINSTFGALSVQGSVSTIAAATTGGAGGSAKFVIASETAADAAYQLFFRLGTFAGFLGIDTDNHLKYGGGNVGAVSHKILHEGNSFTLGAGVMNTGQDLTCRDLTLTRGDTSGLLSFGNGSAGARYLFCSTAATFALAGAPLVCERSLSVNTNQTPFMPLVAQVGAGANFVVYPSGATPDPGIGAMADGGASWKTLAIGGGAGSVVPGLDNATTFGFLSPYRWSAIYAANGTIQTSDGRQKKNIAPSTLGLAFIEDLNPVSYQWIVERNVVTRVPDYEEEVPEHYDAAGNLVPATTRTIYKDEITPIPGTRTHYGLVAQDVKNAVVAAGATFGGLYEGDTASGSDEQGLGYSEFIAPLVKAVQELSAKVKALEGVKP